MAPRPPGLCGHQAPLRRVLKLEQPPQQLSGGGGGCRGRPAPGSRGSEVCSAGMGAPAHRPRDPGPEPRRNRFCTAAPRCGFRCRPEPSRGLEAALRSSGRAFGPIPPSGTPAPSGAPAPGSRRNAVPAQSVGGSAPWWPPGSLRGARLLGGVAFMGGGGCGAGARGAGSWGVALPWPHLPGCSRRRGASPPSGGPRREGR